MQNIGYTAVRGKKITQDRGLVLLGKPAERVIEKLVYSTLLANDHIFHELEAEYGGVIAQWLLEKMPK